MASFMKHKNLVLS